MKKDKNSSPKENSSTSKEENLIAKTPVRAEKDEVKKAEEKLINANKESK